MQWQDKGQGFLRKNLSGESEYSSFIPSSLDTVVPVELSEETVRLLSACSRKLSARSTTFSILGTSNWLNVMSPT